MSNRGALHLTSELFSRKLCVEEALVEVDLLVPFLFSDHFDSERYPILYMVYTLENNTTAYRYVADYLYTSDYVFQFDANTPLYRSRTLNSLGYFFCKDPKRPKRERWRRFWSFKNHRRLRVIKRIMEQK